MNHHDICDEEYDEAVTNPNEAMSLGEALLLLLAVSCVVIVLGVVAAMTWPLIVAAMN
jgi:uncharacterized membrane protein